MTAVKHLEKKKKSFIDKAKANPEKYGPKLMEAIE